MQATKTVTPTSLPTCPHCHALLGEPGLSGLFYCKGCGAEIEASSLAPPAIAPVAPDAPKPPPVVARTLAPRPAHFSVTEQQGALVLEWSQRRTGADKVVGMSAVLFATCALFLLGNNTSTQLAVIVGAMMTTLSALGLGVWLQGKPKVSAVTLRRDSLDVRHWPHTRLDPSGLSQVYVKEVEHTETYTGSDDTLQERTWYTYDVRARLKDGDHVTLVEDCGSVDLALHLEREIENHYRITDARVLYELPRD